MAQIFLKWPKKLTSLDQTENFRKCCSNIYRNLVKIRSPKSNHKNSYGEFCASLLN